MATELVLLSDVALTEEAVTEVTFGLHPEGFVGVWRGGDLMQAFSAEWESLLTLHHAKVIHDSTEAATAIVDPPQGFALWSEMTIPIGDPSRGRELAEALARRVGGVVRERL